MKNIDAQNFKGMLVCAANNLYNNHKYVDSLNVFPVPDGDTGTNMNLTMMSGINEIINSDNTDPRYLAKSFSKGLLMGARGNSGVILSQIFKGISLQLEKEPIIDAATLARCFKNGTFVAYNAVLNPVEGTILTVIKDISNYLLNYVAENPNISIEELFEQALEETKKSLEKTPELLPVLKEAGVVDSGGAGLLYIIEGMYSYLIGQNIEKKQDIKEAEEHQSSIDDADDSYGYCTEFVLRLTDFNKFNLTRFKDRLSVLGNSIVVVNDEDIVKVHIHTLKPGDVLNYAQEFGEFIKLKIENMQEQHNNIIATSQEKKPYGIIAVSVGSGLEKIFKELRVDYIVKGGNTMNPATADFIEAIKKVNAKDIIILPNNSNILLAAKQAASITKDVNVHVIETKTIPQGILACMMFNPEEPIEVNLKEMNDSLSKIKTGQLTCAIRDSITDDFVIKKNDYIGLSGKKIVAVSQEMYTALEKMLKNMVDSNDGLLTIYTGEGAKEEVTKKLEKYATEELMLEVEIKEGNQPVYSYIISVE